MELGSWWIRICMEGTVEEAAVLKCRSDLMDRVIIFFVFIVLERTRFFTDTLGYLNQRTSLEHNITYYTRSVTIKLSGIVHDFSSLVFY